MGMVSPPRLPSRDGRRVARPSVVDIDNGYYGRLASAHQSFIDFSDIVDYDHATLLNGPITIGEWFVPDGLAWYIDNLYFIATALWGPTGNSILGPGDIVPWVALEVFTTSSQLEYTGFESFAPLPITSFPLLNDRIGAREAVFGFTLYEGDSIRATFSMRQVAVPIIPIRQIGFRFMGIGSSKSEIEDYLELKQWSR